MALRALSANVVVIVLAVACSVSVIHPALAECPARISSATIIGSTISGVSSIYAISVDIDTPEIPDPTIVIKEMRLYVHDDAGNESWVFVPEHKVSDWNHGHHLDYFSFGWRHAKRFQISIANLTVSESQTAVCGKDWQAGRSLSDSALDAGGAWDDWSLASRPTVDLVAFHPARIVNEAAVRMHAPDGPDSASCEIAVTVDPSGRPTAFEISKTSGYRPFDEECIDAAKRSTYQSATFGSKNVAATCLFDWVYATIE